MKRNQGQIEVIKFATVGLFCTVLNLILLWLLVDVSRINLFYAVCVCFLVINSLGHYLHKRFTYERPDRRLKDTLPKYYFVMALSLGLNLTLMFLLVETLELNYIAASVVTTGVLFVANYLSHRDWTFR